MRMQAGQAAGCGHGSTGRRGGHGPTGMNGPAGTPVFRSFEADRDGKVSAAEAEAGVETLPTTRDADRSGALSEAEFAALFAGAVAAMPDDGGDKAIGAKEIALAAKAMARMGGLTDAAGAPADPKLKPRGGCPKAPARTFDGTRS